MAHDVEGANERCQWVAAAEDFAAGRQVCLYSEFSLRPTIAESEPRHDFVEDQDCFMPCGQIA